MAVLRAKQVDAKIRKLNGNLAAVGRSFGVTRQAVHDFIKKRPALIAAVADCRESMKDDAEGSLQKAVRSGEGWAVCFYLKTQAKERGYIERSDVRVAIEDLDAAIERELARLAGGSQD